MQTLPDTQREVILLREVEELEYDEIAQITGLGLNNIRTILSRARSRVKELQMLLDKKLEGSWASLRKVV